MMPTIFKLRDAINCPTFGEVVVDTSYTFEGYYETMVFRKDRSDDTLCFCEPLDTVQYATEHEAIAGHEQMLEKWRKR